MTDLTQEERALILSAINPRNLKHPHHNRVACHLAGPTGFVARGLVAKGLFFEDWREHYGKMRVFRATKAAFVALGYKRPKPSLIIEPPTMAKAA